MTELDLRAAADNRLKAADHYFAQAERAEAMVKRWPGSFEHNRVYQSEARLLRAHGNAIRIELNLDPIIFGWTCSLPSPEVTKATV